MDVTVIHTVLAVGTIGVQLLMIAAIGLFFLPRQTALGQWLRAQATPQAVLTPIYVISLLATLGSLHYSELRGFSPCSLCWYQRTLMYPQALMYLLALIKNDDQVLDYGLLLSVLGLLLAVYHYLLQIGVIATNRCSAVGFSISCSDQFISTFGYITIPLMSATAFGAIVMSILLYKRFR